MSQPLVSVVMAVCNADRFLREAIESVLSQSFADFEFIIVDYGSTDNSKPMVSSYAARDSRIQFHEVPQCVLPAARNAGCFRAQGQYIAVMDADDVALPDRLSLELDYMERHPQITLLGGAVEWINSSGRSFHVHRHPTDDRRLNCELVTHNVFWHPTTIMRKEAFASVGGYRPAFVYAHDYDLALRIAERFECANLEQIVLKYRVHPIQLTAVRHTQQTLCILAAQASAAARSRGQPDPLDAVHEITPALLNALGIGELAQRNSIVTHGRTCIRNMMTAGEYAAALAVARRMVDSDLDQVDPWQVSELHLYLAKLYWREKRISKCLIAVGRALLARPILIGRPLKPLLHRFGLA